MHCSSLLPVGMRMSSCRSSTRLSIFLGTDTTAHTLTTGTWYLLNNIDMLKTLRQELVDVIPDLDSAVSVSWVTLEKLPYLVSTLVWRDGFSKQRSSNTKIFFTARGSQGITPLLIRRARQDSASCTTKRSRFLWPPHTRRSMLTPFTQTFLGAKLIFENRLSYVTRPIHTT